MAGAVFTFRVCWTSSRPVRPDEHTAWVQVVGVDSPAGVLEARQTAVAMVCGSRVCVMPTRAELVAAEL